MFGTIIFVLDGAFSIINWLIIARVIMSWIQFDYSNQTMYKLTSAIYSLTEPIIGPVRDMLGRTALGRLPLDLSPIVAMVALQFVNYLLKNLIILIAVSL